MVSRIVGILLAVCGLTLAARAADLIWLEGEKPTASTVPAPAAGWGKVEYISEGKLLNYAVPAVDVVKMPKDGVVFNYRFTVATPGTYEAWNRVGMENVRAPFEWRIDDGDWATLTKDDLTTDVTEFAYWNSLGWLKMGNAKLAAGTHTLEIRVKPYYDAKGAPIQVYYLSDALALTNGLFVPNGKHRPDTLAWQSAADQAAATAAFMLAMPADPADRTVLPARGNWQVARFDEYLVEDRTGPIPALPDLNTRHWYALPVAGDKFTLKPEWELCHRLLYRARVAIPADARGRGFVLRLPSYNLMATVFVNGKACGFGKTPFTQWDCDITAAVEPGKLNEIVIGIKDAYYGISDELRGKNIRYFFDQPYATTRLSLGFTMYYDFPVATRLESGLLETPILIACGPVYTDDVFAIPSVKKKELGLEITLKNPTAQAMTVQVQNEVIPFTGGKAAKSFAPQTVTIPAGQATVVKLTEGWTNPRLWWPDDPYQYQVVTRVLVNGKIVDTLKTKFGFREWEWNTTRFVLNGVPQQLRGDLVHYATTDPEAAVRAWQANGQNMMRMGTMPWGGMSLQDSLDFMDSHGVPVRRSGIFDGAHASYWVRVGDEKKGTMRANQPLFDNWTAQMTAQVRAERNHPSVFIWSIENEIAFINSRNTGSQKWAEPELTRCAKAVMAMDPTRPVMVDGGRALTDKSLPVNGGHYDETAQRDYPDMAYALEGEWSALSVGQPWPMAMERPIFLGECFYATGLNNGWFAGLGGERAFLGKSDTAEGCGLYAKMLSEGFRWQQLGAFFYWMGSSDTKLHYNSWQPIAAFCRQWNWTFGSGASVERTIKLFNDTRFADPIEFEWQLRVGEQVIQGEKKQYVVAPGMDQTIAITLKMPVVRDRTTGTFLLVCRRGGKEVFRDEKAVAIIVPEGAKAQSTAADLLVYDPDGSAKTRLTARGIPFTEVAAIAALPAIAPNKTILLGRNALTGPESTDSRWYALAASGARLLVLEQNYPLLYQAVPADFDGTNYVGRVAFSENLAHPIFAGLEQQDFFTWSGDHVVYRNPYKKAAVGATSLVQCEPDLTCSAMARCTLNEGMMLLSQLVVGEKLATDPVAQRLFDNMVAYSLTYTLIRNATAVAMDPASPTGKALGASGLQYDTVPDALAAMTGGKYPIVIADATPATMTRLQEQRAAVQAFTERGGWLMLMGLTPEGLTDFNSLLGVSHVMRPFEMEKVTFPAMRDPLTAGLTTRDIALESAEKIYEWKGYRWMVDDEFSYVVDATEDIASFCTFPTGGAPRGNGYPRNLVNGFVMEDSWKYTYYIYPTTGKIAITLPGKEEVRSFGIQIDLQYWVPGKVHLYFDDDPTPVVLTLAETAIRQNFPVKPRMASKLSMEFTDWKYTNRDKTCPLSNMWLTVTRTPENRKQVVPLLNLGLVKYPRGNGGIILNQVKYQEHEANPVNAGKKQTITATILRNLNAIFAGSKVAIQGAGMTYTPIALDDKCTAFLSKDKKDFGWFDTKRDLTHFPVGEVKLAGVTYAVRDFKTSPLPTCIILKGPWALMNMPIEVTGIPVNRTADALFFLHTYLERLNWVSSRDFPDPPTVMNYVIHYADGTQVVVPIRYRIGVGHWLAKEPRGVKEASLAWAAPIPGDTTGEQAAVYQYQWVNPRPDVQITSVDMTYPTPSAARWGTPALLALTAATAMK